MTQSAPSAGNVLSMLFSAAMYLAGGFLLDWTHERLQSGELVPMVVMLKWTLRGGGALFALCAVMAMLRWRAALILYPAVSIIAALSIGAVAVWDYVTPTVYSGVPVVLLAILAIFTLFGAAEELVRHRQRASVHAERP